MKIYDNKHLFESESLLEDLKHKLRLDQFLNVHSCVCMYLLAITLQMIYFCSEILTKFSYEEQSNFVNFVEYDVNIYGF